MATIHKVVCDACKKDIDEEKAKGLNFRLPLIGESVSARGKEYIDARRVDLCDECAKKIADACEDIIKMRIFYC